MNQPQNQPYSYTSQFGYSAETRHAEALNSLSVLHDVSLILIERQGLINMHDLAGRVFLTVAQAQADVLLISQSSAEGNFCFVVPGDSCARVLIAIHDELAPEIERRHIAAIRVIDDVAILTARADTPCTRFSLCERLAQSRVNILVYALGASSTTAVIAAADVDSAVTDKPTGRKH